jgi:hypothetical protein
MTTEHNANFGNISSQVSFLALNSAAGGEWYTAGGTQLPGFPNTWDGGPIYPGEIFQFNFGVNAIGPAGLSLDSPYGCQTFNPQQLELLSAATNSTSYTALIEYGIISGTPPPPDSCGDVGDGAVSWYSSFDTAKANGTIAAVRWKVQGELPYSINRYIRYTFQAVPNDNSSVAMTAGTTIPIGMSLGADHANFSYATNTELKASQPLVSHTITASNTEATSPDVFSGGTETITITPAVQGTAGLGINAPNVSETVSLPNSVTYVSGSARFSGNSVTPNLDGNGNLVFNLGSLPVGQTNSLVFEVNAASSIVTPNVTTITAVINSDGNSTNVNLRTASTTFNIVAPAGVFRVVQSQSASILQPGMGTIPATAQTYTINTMNNTLSPVTDITAIDVLPYNGDANGTTGLDGAMPYVVSGLVATGGGGVELYYTTDVTVRTDPGDDGVTWSSFSSGDLPTDVTAIKWLIPSLASGEARTLTLTLDDFAAANGAQVANALAYLG